MKRKSTAARVARPKGPHTDEEEDSRIALLERKLGIRSKSGSIPKSFQDDGALADLFDIGNISDDYDDNDDYAGTKIDSEYQEWLAEKRILSRKGADFGGAAAGLGEDDADAGHEQDDDDEFHGFSDSDDVSHTESPQKKRRENPYVAPVPASSGHYVPPPRRQVEPVSQGDERLRKQVRSLVNRLNAANIGRVVRDVEALYGQSARGDVTEAVVDALLNQVCSPTASGDTFFIDTAGFVAALYRIVGESFASVALTKTVLAFRDAYGSQGTDKSATNLAALLSELYLFDVVACNLIFDMIRLLLGELSELNTELILCITKVAGQALVKDDAAALEDICTRLRGFLSSADEGAVSARTKFMVESISDLRRKRKKPSDRLKSDVAKERATSMKKFLGTLSDRSGRKSSTRSLPIGLCDIEKMGVSGKWWLVGASYAGNTSQNGRIVEPPVAGPEAAETAESEVEDESEDQGRLADEEKDLDLFCPDYAKAAREQGLTTDVELAIFVAICQSGGKADEAHQRLQQLRLNKHRRDVAFVLFQMAGAYQPYDHLYVHVAEKVCANGQMRFAFQHGLWQILQQLGAPIFDNEADQADDRVSFDAARASNVGRFVGGLVAWSVLSIKVLRCLDLMSVKEKQVTLLVTHLLLTTLQYCLKKEDKEKEQMRKVELVFSQAVDEPVLAAGLHFLLSKRAKREAGRVEWIRKKHVDRIGALCEHACRVLTRDVVVHQKLEDM